MLAYYKAFDEGRHEEARNHIQTSYEIAAHNGWLHGLFYELVTLEYAFVLARTGKSLQLAIELYESVELEELKSTKLRTLAAIQIATGTGDAKLTLDEAERLLSTHPDRDRDNMQAEADWLRDLRRMM